MISHVTISHVTVKGAPTLQWYCTPGQVTLAHCVSQHLLSVHLLHYRLLYNIGLISFVCIWYRFNHKKVASAATNILFYNIWISRRKYFINKTTLVSSYFSKHCSFLPVSVVSCLYQYVFCVGWVGVGRSRAPSLIHLIY